MKLVDLFGIGWCVFFVCIIPASLFLKLTYQNGTDSSTVTGDTEGWGKLKPIPKPLFKADSDLIVVINLEDDVLNRLPKVFLPTKLL